MDKIVQGNTANIIFLKSTDDAMLDTLQKMSGTTHKVYRDGKQVTRDMEKLILQNEGKVTISLSVKEQPVISYNDMAFMPMCNSIVFRAGDSPIWNRNQTCLPMSWRLFANTIEQPGKKYSLQTVPTLSTALDFDVRKNMPDFLAMWEKRRKQALEVTETEEAYRAAYSLDDTGIARLDPDKYADEIMRFVNQKLGAFVPKSDDDIVEDADADKYYRDDRMESAQLDYMDNMAVVQAAREAQAIDESWKNKIYCNGMLSRDMLCPLPSRTPNHKWDEILINLFCDPDVQKSMCADYDHFRMSSDGSLLGSKGQVLIQRYALDMQKQDAEALNSAVNKRRKDIYEAQQERMAAYAAAGCEITEEEVELDVHDGWQVMDAFYNLLISEESWRVFADGEFEIAFTEELKGSDLKNEE